MDKILLFIENNLDKEITNSELADIAGYSVSAFTHRFKTEMNESVQAYICRRRLLCDVQTKGDYSAISERLAPELRLLVEKLSDGLSEDIQLIKLAERVHNMRTIDYIDDSKKAIKAKESLDVYMPIAREIGNQKLIDELNDLSLKYS